MTAIDTYGAKPRLVGDRLGERILTFVAGPRYPARQRARQAWALLLGAVCVGMAVALAILLADLLRPAPGTPERPAAQGMAPATLPAEPPRTTPPVPDMPAPRRSTPPAPAPAIAEPPRTQVPAAEPVERLPAPAPAAPEIPAAAPAEPRSPSEPSTREVSPEPRNAPPGRFETLEETQPVRKPRVIRPRAERGGTEAPRFEIPQSLRPSS